MNQIASLKIPLKKLLIRVFLPLFFIFSTPSMCAEDVQSTRKLEAHFLIRDYQGAKELAEKLIQNPSQKKIGYPYLIKALAKTGHEKEMWSIWHLYKEEFPEEAQDRSIMEELAWGIIEKSVNTDSMTIHLIGLLAAGLTQDIRAVPILKDNLHHSNALFRSISAELSGHYRDVILADEISMLFKHEKVYEVKLAMLEALKTLKLDFMENEFIKILESPSLTSEEKSIAIQAIATLRKERVVKGEEISRMELENLIRSHWSSLRALAAECIALFSTQGNSDLLEKLLQDSNPEVVAYALKAVGLKPLAQLKQLTTLPAFLLCTESKDPLIALTSAWVLMRVNPLSSEKIYRRFLNSSKPETRALAACSLANSGKEGLSLCYEILKKHDDPYVRANVCFGLIGGQYHVNEAAEELFQFLTETQEQWMKDKFLGSFFEPIVKSRLKHKSSIPNYPEVVNQSLRLEVLNVLAILNHPKALSAMKAFLKERTWGVSAIAAETLLGVGDEEALDLIRQCLLEKDPLLRLQAALVLAVWGKDFSAVPILIESYGTCDRMTKIKIMEALSQAGAPHAIPFLIEEMQNSSQTLRTLAAYVLLQTLNHGCG